MKTMRRGDLGHFFLAFVMAGAVVFESGAQESLVERKEVESGQLKLRKTVEVRNYKGRDVEGENRLIAPGDTLWRILIQEKGLPEKRFSHYVVVIRGLNPQIKTPDILRIGDNVFIPLRPDEVVEARAVTEAQAPRTRLSFAPGATKDYRVKRGDHLYQILREQLGITDERELAVYYALTKDLNPVKKDWDLLENGEMIRLPTTGEASAVASAPRKGVEAAPPQKETKPKQETPPAAEKASPSDYAGQPPVRPARPEVTAPVKEIKPPREAAPQAPRSLPPETKQEIAQPRERGQAAPSPKEKKPILEVKPGVTATASTDQRGQPAAPSGEVVASPPVARREPIREAPPAEAPKKTPLDYARQLPARENLPLINRIAQALGGEVQNSGEEIFTLTDGTVRVDKGAYPVVYSPKLQQRVVIDPQDNIPPVLRKQLDDPRVAAPVVPLSKASSLQEAVSQLLSRLGYQPLPENRPVVIQEGGIAYEAKGSWMALAPQESNKTQEILVITLTEENGEIPEYLKTQLAHKGLHLKDVLLHSSAAATPLTGDGGPQKIARQVKKWPREKKEIVDAMLFAYNIPFGVSETLSVELRAGLRIDKRADRLFNLRGTQTALFFQRIEPEIKKALDEKHSTKVIEIDLASLDARELIAQMLSELGERAPYRQHRFSAGKGNPERLNITAWGFLLNSRSIFLTDHEIPPPMHRFFFEKGLEIVYFQ